MEKHVTRLSADVSLLCERMETMLTEHLDTCELRGFLVDVTHDMFTQITTYCSEFGTRFDSILAALWDH